MKRHVAVLVQYPRLSYVDLFPLDGRQRARRRLAPIEIDQRVAVVKLFLMRSEERSGGPVVPDRLLHTFRVDSLPAGANSAAVLTLDAEYDGARTVHLRISGGGIPAQTADVRVPRRRRWWWVLLLVLFLGMGTYAMFRMSSFSVRPEPPSETEEPVTAPGTGTDSSDNAVNADDTAVADQDPAPEESETATGGASSSGEADDPDPEPALPETEVRVHFEPNRTRLTDAARRELDQLASLLRDHPEASVSIVGHTALYGTEEGRTEISQGRAQGVASYLRSRGWEPESEPSVRWVGSREPVTRDRDEQERNRRVEVSVGGDQSSR